MSLLRNRKPKQIGTTTEILSFVVKNPLARSKLKQLSFSPYWKDIVGENASKFSKPEKVISGSILVIKVYNNSWAQELSLLKEQILEKIYYCCEGIRFEDLRFVVGNPKEFNLK